MIANNQQSKFKDDSRFTHWVNGFDEKDKLLTTSRRKRKWILITGGVFMLFVLSFLLFPSAKPEPTEISAPYIGSEYQGKAGTAWSAFELPVDSFENHLKTIIDEELPEKE